jgi:hypothetical protein
MAIATFNVLEAMGQPRNRIAFFIHGIDSTRA